jgi:O-antigen/teichoic acid export membrane protein
MEKQKSIKLNFVMNAILTMSSFIFPLITFPYISRVLQAEGVGKVSFATSVISYFLIFAQLGTPIYGIRACARVRDNKEELSRTVHEIFIINAVMSLLAYGAFVIVLSVVPRFQNDKALYIIASFSVVFTTIGMEWLYKALEQYSYITVRSIIFKFIALFAVFLLVKNPVDYKIYAGITIFASSASNILNFIRVRKYIKIYPMGNYCLKRHMKSIFIFFAMSCATTIYTNLDSVMLGFMKTYADVGYYATAIKIKNILASIVSSLSVVLLPRVTYYIKNGLNEEFEKITRKATNFIFLIASPLIVYFSVYAKECIYFLAGSNYDSSILPMQIAMPTLLCIGLTNIMGIQILVPLGKEKVVLYSEIVGAVVDLVFNLIFIPILGISGAALSTLIAEISVFIFQYYALRDVVIDSFKKISYIKIFFACVIAIIFAWLVKLLYLSTFWTLLFSGISFFGLYGIILILQKESMIAEYMMQFLREIDKRIRRSS